MSLGSAESFRGTVPHTCVTEVSGRGLSNMCVKYDFKCHWVPRNVPRNGSAESNGGIQCGIGLEMAEYYVYL